MSPEALGSPRPPRRRIRFCIVTTAQICRNPRVVKEADALAAAGHDVRVVAYDRDETARRLDVAMMQGRQWRLDSVAIHNRTLGRTVGWVWSGVRQRAARALADRGVRAVPIRDVALSKHLWRMAARVAAEPADVVVAHHAPALPSAWRAADKLGARLAFDFEDLHVANVASAPRDIAEGRLIAAIDRAYLPRCHALLASSSAIADEVVRRYGVSRPTVVLNTFPLSAPTARATSRDRVGQHPSFYWFSQVVGPNRGLEEAVVALARAAVPAELHLRGARYGDFAEHLHRLAREHGMVGTLHIHGSAPPEELPALAGQHDVGLALEQNWSLNARLALSNKLLTYLVCGNAILATDTPGQREALDAAPGAGRVYRAGDVDALASHMRTLATDPEALEAARRAARAAAVRRFSWEHDAPVLVSALEAVVP